MDPILLWNEVALEADRVSHTIGMGEQAGPTLSSRALAIVHLAMYDAYAGVINDATNLPPYIPGSSSPGASPDVAVAAAAHKALSSLYPSQRPFFDSILAGAGDESDPVAHPFGEMVATKILDDRKDDPSAGAGDYKPSPQRGKHRPDPDTPGQGFHAPFYGARSKGFAITDRHELDAPPFDNAEYRKALQEVRGKGIAPELMGTLPLVSLPVTSLPLVFPRRKVDETLIGIYWAYDGASRLGTPPRLYNQIVRKIAIAKNNTVAENARLFALVNTAMADAGILAWDQKYIHDLWRPVVGIREHDPSMGPEGGGNNDISDDCDLGWLPLGAPNTNVLGKNFTPPFPAYPSGHATFGAAALHITRLFYGVSTSGPDNLLDGLTFVSEELNGVNRDNKGTLRPRHVRNFEDGGLWQMIVENGRSRVFLGVHWVFDAFAVDDNGAPNLSRNVGGVPLGLKIAEDIFMGGRANGLKKSPVVPRS